MKVTITAADKKRHSQIRMIKRRLLCGLPRATSIYNYLGCYGEIEVTDEMINDWIEAREAEAN